jgi:hypothetical protein
MQKSSWPFMPIAALRRQGSHVQPGEHPAQPSPLLGNPKKSTKNQRDISRGFGLEIVADFEWGTW